MMKFWKKIIYYFAAAVIGVLYILSMYYSDVTNRVKKFTSDKIDDGEYSDVVRFFTALSNKQPVFSTTLSDECIVQIYETSSPKKLTISDKRYNQLDSVYSVFLFNSKIKYTDTQNEYGDTINYTGFEISNGTDSYTYSVNKNEDEGDYSEIIINSDDMNLYEIEIPKKFVESKINNATISSLKILNSDGTPYADLTLTLNYTSDFFTTVQPVITAYNEAKIEGIVKEYNDYYDDEFLPGFLANENYQDGYSQSQIFGTSFYVLIVLKVIIYITIILVLGDFLVGKRRILRLIYRMLGRDDQGRKIVKNADGTPMPNDEELIDNRNKPNNDGNNSNSKDLF